MPKRTSKKSPKKKATKKSPKQKAPKRTAAGASGRDFDLNEEYYEQLSSYDVYSIENKTTRVFGVRDKTGDDTPYIKARTRSKRPYGWRYQYGIDLHNNSHVSRLIAVLLHIARRLGWKLQGKDDTDKLKTQLREREEAIVNLERSNRTLRQDHDKLMAELRRRQEDELRSRVDEFSSDLEALSTLLERSNENLVSEEELQEFLYAHPWLFGTEYISSEPQKLRGAHSKFDFYLERFNKTNDIVEIKRPSDTIVNKDGSISAKVVQAVDQLIAYMESSQAAAHSTVIAQEEGIGELRPRGIVIIGNDTGKEARKKLHMWNYQFGHITLLTFGDLLEKGRSVLGHIQGEGTP